MTEHPILFSGPMVRAILAGTKTQTRRLAKWPKKVDDKYNGSMIFPAYNCPYGMPGDLLWVRETFSRWGFDAETGRARIKYQADESQRWIKSDDLRASMRAIPSIHMPRWASRLTLRITDVRAQRLQEISEEDALAEGVPVTPDWFGPVDAYRVLWDSINAKRAPWSSNPWVWALSFEVVR